MRKLIGLVAFFSAQAFACPDLTGAYTCVYQDGSSEVLTISQENKDGVINYDYNGSIIPADNATYPMPDSEDLREGTFRAWCEADILKAEMLGKYYNGGSYFGDLTLNMEFTLVDSNLRQVTTGNLVNSGGDYPLDSEVTCTRNQMP